MSEIEATTRPFRMTRVFLGILYTLIGYTVVVAASAVAAQLNAGGGNSGWADLAAFASVLVIGGGAVIVGSIITGVIMLGRGRRDLGAGLLIGGLLGVVAAVVLTAA